MYIWILLVIFFSSYLLARIKNINLYHNKKSALLVTLLFFTVGTIWDSYAVANRYWTFGKSSLLGIKIGYLPVEEYLLFLIVPYFVLVSYRFFNNEK